MTVAVQVFIIFAVITGGVIYSGARIVQRLHTEDRTVRLRRGLMVLGGTIAFFLFGAAFLSWTKLGDEPGGAIAFTIPWVICSSTGFVMALHLLFSGAKGDYLP